MIDYNILAESVVYYAANQYKRIEAPWTVSEYVDSITRPADKVPFQLKHNNKCLVASGEQSFLYLYLKEFLPKGQFQTITPCFREDSFDFTHTKYFMKNELIKTDVVNISELEKMVALCEKFFNQYLHKVSIVKTPEGFDINFEERELGSYGIRQTPFLNWIYGTGVAEPRFSKIIFKDYGLSLKKNP